MERKTVSIILEKNNQYLYKISQPVDPKKDYTSLTLIRLHEQIYRVPIGTIIEYLDCDRQSIIKYYLLDRPYHPSDIPILSIGGDLCKRYRLNYYGFSLKLPVGTIYKIGCYPEQQIVIPTKVILDGLCNIIIPAPSKIWLQNVDDPTDTFLCEKDLKARIYMVKIPEAAISITEIPITIPENHVDEIPATATESDKRPTDDIMTMIANFIKSLGCLS
jgi:hypothetical protein